MKYARSIAILLWGLFFTVQTGAQSWQWGRANTGGEADGWPVATDRYGNVFVAGDVSGLTPAAFGAYTVPFGGGVANYQCVIAKYDAAGNCQWARGSSLGSANLIGISTDPAGNAYMFGSFDSGLFKIGTFTLANSYKKNDYEYFLAKFDPLGNVLWAVAAGNTQSAFVVAGGISNVLSIGGIATDASGNVYVTANFHRKAVTIGAYTLTNADPSGLTDDILLVKYDPLGNVLWATSAGGNMSDEAYGITVTPAGDVYIAGNFGSAALTFGTSVISNTSPGANQVVFIARYDGTGNPLWATSSGGAGNENAVGLASDASNNVYLTGGLNDNSISFNGTAIANPYPGKPVLYLVQFDPSNNVNWYKTIGSPIGGTAWGYSVATSSCGYVWVGGVMSVSVTDSAGTFANQVSVDGNTLTVLAGSPDPVFIAGYTTSGAYVASSALQCGGDDQVGIACDPSGNVYLCSDYYGVNPVIIGNDHLPVNADSLTELMYIAKYAPPIVTNPNNFTHSDTSICLTSGISLSAAPGYITYLWNDGKTGAVHSVSDTGTFWVRGDDTCGIYTIDTFRVNNSCDCGKYLFVPNTFTPNGDGENDTFYPRSSHGSTQIRSFRIYNRWGELLFERDNITANDASNAWDGSYQGNLSLPDVYVYMVDAVCENGAVVHKKGSVTVIR